MRKNVQAVPRVMQKNKLFHVSCKKNKLFHMSCKKTSCSTCCKNHAKNKLFHMSCKNHAKNKLFHMLQKTMQKPCKMRRVRSANPPNPRSPRVPCYMCYICYMALCSTYTTDFRAYRIYSTYSTYKGAGGEWMFSGLARLQCRAGGAASMPGKWRGREAPGCLNMSEFPKWFIFYLRSSQPCPSSI